MIAQTCLCSVASEKADEYFLKLRTASAAQSRNIPANVAAFALVRNEEKFAHLMLLSFWASLESLSAAPRWFLEMEATIEVHAVFGDERIPMRGEAPVARMWHGAVPLSKSDAYLELMRTVAFQDYARTPGNRAAFALHRVAGGLAHFTMLTFWESRDAITAFAGHNIEVAKYYEFDRAYLVELEPTVLHYDVLGNG